MYISTQTPRQKDGKLKTMTVNLKSFNTVFSDSQVPK